ncbi:MAG: SAM-dependent methyltransferase, partial [Sphingorhabdus sp.]
MNSPDVTRGRHLTHATGLRAFTGGLFVRGFQRIVDRIDQGIVFGSIEAALPDGSIRLLGGRGEGPLAIVTLHSWKALLRLARGGSTGWYEAWAAGEWSSPDPVLIFDLFMRNRQSLGNVARPSGLAKLAGKAIHAMRRNNRTGARRNIEFHYDLGNDFYQTWLDESMTYSSAMFADPHHSAETLESAQHRKIEALLDRLALSDGEKLLEIGCGWGGLAEVALRAHRVHYHGITLSSEQKVFADERLSGLGDAEVTLTDYRDVSGQYDAIASVEMVEAVGQQYWPDYLKSVARCLKP